MSHLDHDEGSTILHNCPKNYIYNRDIINKSIYCKQESHFLYWYRYIFMELQILIIYTINICMIRGYTAPEYAIGGHLSEKVDIYSFGIVILEIISGRKCSDVNVDSTTEYLLREVN